MRNLSYMLPILTILALGMAHKYKDDPKVPFEVGITIGWWAFGITTIITIIVAVISDKKCKTYFERVIPLATMPIVTLIAIGLIALMKNSIS